MYEKLEKCPLCGSPKIKNYLICQDHMASKESFAINQCNDCHFLFTNPRPDESGASAFYDSPDYISHGNSQASILSSLYKTVRMYTLRRKVRLIEQNTSKHRRLLDVGSGTGDFLKVANCKGWQISGVEVNQAIRLQYPEDFREHLYGSIFDIKEKEAFDAITLWHVLEHIYPLHKTLKKLRKLKAPKGRIFLAVPNHKSYDAQYYQEHWAGYDVPRHLYHFGRDTMKTLLEKNGLKIQKILPMKFDSYYVSLLSEKYKSGSLNYFNAFKTGRLSNQKAKSTKEFSSLIYIVK